MVYSTQNAIDRAFKNKEKKLILQSKAQHPDVKLARPDFTRDAGKANPDFTLHKAYIKQLKEEHMKKLAERQQKLGDRL